METQEYCKFDPDMYRRDTFERLWRKNMDSDRKHSNLEVNIQDITGFFMECYENEFVQDPKKNKNLFISIFWRKEIGDV